MTQDQEEPAGQVMSDGVMSTGEGMRIFPDVEACIDCGGCVVACKRTWDREIQNQRIDIMTMAEGTAGPQGENADKTGRLEAGENPGETHMPMQCYHCHNAPCVSVCPTDALQKEEDGFVAVHEDLCVGCQYCLSGCPFGAPQFPDSNDGSAQIFGTGGIMDKCTGCRQRQEVQKGPACAEECATDAILVGGAGEIADELESRDSQPFFNRQAMEVIFGADDAQLFE